MFRKLFGRSGGSGRVAEARIPDGLRVYCIGDIHGRADLLAELHKAIASDAARAPVERKIVVYVGDYIDRGLESRSVIDQFLSDPLPDFEKVYLKGNHDETLLQFLNDAEVGPYWFTYGGDATVLSYGVRLPPGKTGPERFEDMRLQFASLFPADHLEFFSALQLTYVCGDYVFVHAGLRPGVPLDRQSPEDLLWIRGEFLESRYDFGKIVVHGHSVSEAPVMATNRIGIDTGAYASGRLTCLVLEGGNREVMNTEIASRSAR